MKEKKLPYRVTFEHILPESRLVLEDHPLDPEELEIPEAQRLLVRAGLAAADWLIDHAAPLFVSALFHRLLEHEAKALEDPRPITSRIAKVWRIMAEMQTEADHGQA